MRKSDKSHNPCWGAWLLQYKPCGQWLRGTVGTAAMQWHHRMWQGASVLTDWLVVYFFRFPSLQCATEDNLNIVSSLILESNFRVSNLEFHSWPYPTPSPNVLRGCKNPVQNCISNISMAQRRGSPHTRVNSGIPAMMRPILLTPRGNLCDLVCSSNRIAS